jgi:hypothetical protein
MTVPPSRRARLKAWWARTPLHKKAAEILIAPLLVGTAIAAAQWATGFLSASSSPGYEASRGPSSATTVAPGLALDLVSATARYENRHIYLDMVVRNTSDDALVVTAVALVYNVEVAFCSQVSPGSTYEPEPTGSTPAETRTVDIDLEGKHLGPLGPGPMSSVSDLVQYSLAERVPAHDVDRFQVDVTSLRTEDGLSCDHPSPRGMTEIRLSENGVAHGIALSTPVLL